MTHENPNRLGYIYDTHVEPGDEGGHYSGRHAVNRKATKRLSFLDHNHFRADRFIEHVLSRTGRENAALLCLAVGSIGLIARLARK